MLLVNKTIIANKKGANLQPLFPLLRQVNQQQQNHHKTPNNKGTEEVIIKCFSSSNIIKYFNK